MVVRLAGLSKNLASSMHNSIACHLDPVGSGMILVV